MLLSGEGDKLLAAVAEQKLGIRCDMLRKGAAITHNRIGQKYLCSCHHLRFDQRHLGFYPVLHNAPSSADSLQLSLTLKMSNAACISIPTWLALVFGENFVDRTPVSRKTKGKLLVVNLYLERKRGNKVVDGVVLGHQRWRHASKECGQSLAPFCRGLFWWCS